MKALTKKQGNEISTMINTMTVAKSMWDTFSEDGSSREKRTRWSLNYAHAVVALADAGIPMPAIDVARYIIARDIIEHHFNGEA